jgi:hypothetical protein
VAQFGTRQYGRNTAPAGTVDPAITDALRESPLVIVALLRCLNDGVKTSTPASPPGSTSIRREDLHLAA